MSRRIVTYQVDAFTHHPFAGNPAAVCLLRAGDLPLSAKLRQQIAAEMNLAETAFLEPVSASDGEAQQSTNSPSDDLFTAEPCFRLRWFTPTVEVPLCGHATIAAAAALMHGEGNATECMRFDTLSGELTVKRTSVSDDASEGDKGVEMLQLDMPLHWANDKVPASRVALDGLGKAVAGDWPVLDYRYCARLSYLVAVLSSDHTQAEFEQLVPNMPQLEAFCKDTGVGAVVLTTKGDRTKYDFLCRFFAPAMGISEDPVTGSAYTILGPYWSPELAGPDAKHLRARQCSKRGGDVLVTTDWSAGRVTVAGGAVVVLKGVLTVPDERAVPEESA